MALNLFLIIEDVSEWTIRPVAVTFQNETYFESKKEAKKQDHLF